MTRIQTLQEKEVININDGAKIGFVADIEIDVQTGKVISIIVLNSYKTFGFFGKTQEYIIPWCEIKKIGDDIILIDVDLEKCLCSK